MYIMATFFSCCTMHSIGVNPHELMQKKKKKKMYR